MPGMDSEGLSARAKQPGHDQTYKISEGAFISVAREVLDPTKYVVQDHPRTLSSIFGGKYGVIPEASVTNINTGRMFFVEVKKQGNGGNAEERAFKHHTLQFQKTLHEYFGYSYHPFVTVFCESLATNSRYTTKFKYLIEPGHYFLWVNYNQEDLETFLSARCQEWLD